MCKYRIIFGTTSQCVENQKRHNKTIEMIIEHGKWCFCLFGFFYLMNYVRQINRIEICVNIDLICKMTGICGANTQPHLASQLPP